MARHPCPMTGMPKPVIIENQPFWAKILTLFWAAEMLFGAVLAGVGATWLGGPDGWPGAAVMVVGLLLVMAGAMMADISWRIARLVGPAIEMTPQGLRDRRLSDVMMPWHDLDWRLVFNGKSHSLQFDLRPALRNQVRLTWAHALMAALNRLFRYPEFTILTLGTGMSAAGIAEHMRSFRPDRN